MTDSSPDLATLLPRLYEKERRETAPPSVEEILAYLEGELPEPAEADVRARLALHPEAADLLLDLADPDRLGGEDDEALPLPDREALRERLRAEGLFEPPAKVVPLRARANPVYGWLAAAALLVLSVGLGGYLLREPTLAPPADDAVWELLPRGESGRRDGRETIEAIDDFSHALVLYAPALAPGVAYRALVVDDAGEEVLRRTLRTNVAGQVVLRLAPEELAPGRHEIRLFAGNAETPLAIYELDWRR